GSAAALKGPLYVRLRRATLSGSRSPSNREVLNQLDQIKSGVADHRADKRSTAQVHGAPVEPQRTGRNRDVVALQTMTEAERDARDDEAGRGTAEPDLESMQDERPLNFFADAAGDDNADGKQNGTARTLDEVLQRIAAEVVQR